MRSGVEIRNLLPHVDPPKGLALARVDIAHLEAAAEDGLNRPDAEPIVARLVDFLRDLDP
eukprot:1591301-Pyramimonas_sp.AAC.1